jgi:hypothetical protein
MSKAPAQTISVVEVTQADLMAHAGRPWSDVTSGELPVKDVPYWDSNVIAKDRPNWTPPLDRQNNPVPFLPVGSAWLREVDGRAFLYAQNF